MTYGNIVNRLLCHSAQAVGSAISRNPLAIFVLYYRVLSSKGKLTVYAADLEKKLWLLEHEGVDVTQNLSL
ncbi:MGMT family protein [Streptococcus sciuri]|uniref:MGMT family protein n=1 Tax=Streptococcus sciuri TaxID=2973939 RepID=A0ABT2FA63_9STRE|nr:MGMT family protein [Streptococcus sciuri]MCS4488730.1 MGMT family protein [Streptococcus sciuri]